MYIFIIILLIIIIIIIIIINIYNFSNVSIINMPIFRRTNYIITASGIVTLCTVHYSLLQRVTIPDAVIIQFVLLKMGMLITQ